jgi:hypothetical protein
MLVPCAAAAARSGFMYGLLPLLDFNQPRVVYPPIKPCFAPCAAAAAGFIRGLLPLLDSNLPRVWLSVDEASGLAEPLRRSISHGHPSRVGGDGWGFVL